MLPLHTRATITGTPNRAILKLIRLEEFLADKRLDAEDCALSFEDSAALHQSRALTDIPWGALVSTQGEIPKNIARPACTVEAPRIPGVIAPGDVIRINARNHLVSVLHRRGARSNSLLVTERCNSYCVMCSQPPIERDDSHRVQELLDAIRLIDPTEPVLGITGGEPTLLAGDLARLLASLKHNLPDTRIHVLTNGRRFADSAFTAQIVSVGHDRVMWAIPLYSDVPEIHDYVVQRRGAFHETLQGLLNLAEAKQHIELRVVLQQATVPRLRQLAHFITRNLTFVDHVAWMGLEPMGFARPNWKALWIEPSDYAPALQAAVEQLDHFRIDTSIYNLPLCVLPSCLHRFAARSISDWKNGYQPECRECAARTHCCGFFSSASREHLPKGIRPYT